MKNFWKTCCSPGTLSLEVSLVEAARKDLELPEVLIVTVLGGVGRSGWVVLGLWELPLLPVTNKRLKLIIKIKKCCLFFIPDDPNKQLCPG